MPHLRKAAIAAVGGALVLAACGSSSSSSSTSGGGSSSSSAAFPPIPAGPIKLGMIAPLTGPNAQSGQFLKVGFNLLIGDLNAAGGIDGHQVTFVTGDDKADPATGAAEAHRLAESEKVAGILEPGTGETTFQIMPVLTQDKIPTIAILPENELDKPSTYPYYFSTYPLNSLSAVEIVKYAKTLGITKLAVARDNTGFGDSYLPVIQQQVQSQGITITDTETFSISATDVKTQISKLKDSGADGLIILSVGAVVGHVYEAMQALGWSPPTVGTYSLLYSGVTSLGALAKTTFFSCGVGVDSGAAPDPGLLKLVQENNTKIAKLPTNAGSLWSADALQLFKAAIEKNHSVDPDAIKSAMESFSGVSFTSSKFSYTFSPTEHAGWPQSQMHMCRLDGFDPNDIPIFAPNS
jgi:branched-chain amino acid transport system substrate-binding protein